MAIITVSRQYFSCGDEICKRLAEKMNYKFIDKKVIREKMLQLGFDEKKLEKFDGVKPGFFSIFSLGRESYLHCLRTAILMLVADGNCVVVGRGAFLFLKNLKNHISVQIFEERRLRTKRAMETLGLSVNEAIKKVKREDMHQFGFYKTNFKFRLKDYFKHNIMINSGETDIESAACTIEAFAKSYITEKKEEEGKAYLDELLVGQRIANLLIFAYDLQIDEFVVDFDRNSKTVVLNGITSSSATVERAIQILACEIPEYSVKSKIRVVQDSYSRR